MYYWIIRLLVLLNVGIDPAFDIEYFISIDTLNNSNSSYREQRIIRHPDNVGSNLWDTSVSYLVLRVVVSSDMGDFVALSRYFLQYYTQ